MQICARDLSLGLGFWCRVLDDAVASYPAWDRSTDTPSRLYHVLYPQSCAARALYWVFVGGFSEFYTARIRSSNVYSGTSYTSEHMLRTSKGVRVIGAGPARSNCPPSPRPTSAPGLSRLPAHLLVCPERLWASA